MIEPSPTAFLPPPKQEKAFTANEIKLCFYTLSENKSVNESASNAVDDRTSNLTAKISRGRDSCAHGLRH